MEHAIFLRNLFLRNNILTKTVNLFQILADTLEKTFCPWLIFGNGWLNVNKEALVAEVFWSAGVNTSFIYKGLKLLKYLKVVEQIVRTDNLWLANLFFQIRLSPYGRYYIFSDRSKCICDGGFIILSLICYLDWHKKLSTHN